MENKYRLSLVDPEHGFEITAPSELLTDSNLKKKHQIGHKYNRKTEGMHKTANQFYGGR